MRKLWLLGLFILVGIGLAACGGGSSNDSNTEEVPIATPDGFTAEMLDAKTYYVTFPAEPDGTKEQDTIVFSGTGPYTVEATEEYFDANNAFIETDTYTVNVTLNEDGTLTATDDSGGDPATVTLTGKTNTYLSVSGTDGTDTWTERWYFAKPADWLSQDSGSGTTGFTTEMLNATYYVKYNGDADGTTNVGTTQETIVFSGTGSYTVNVNSQYFDANNTYVSTETVSLSLVLNQDGTLSLTDISETVTLTGQTDAYLTIHGTDGTDTWDDDWFFAKPAGWLTAPALPEYQFNTVFLQYRVFESQTPRYTAYVSMTKDDDTIQEVDIASMDLLNSASTEMISYTDGFGRDTTLTLNCMVDPCSLREPYTEGGFYAHFTAMPAGTYTLDVLTADNQTLYRAIPYSGQLVVPFVTSGSMQSEWVGNDLKLSWMNPSSEANWSEVDQIQIRLSDSTGFEMLFVRLSPSAETVTISQSVLEQTAGLGDGTLPNWQIQTRAYDSNNMNFARGYSNRIAIVTK